MDDKDLVKAVCNIIDDESTDEVAALRLRELFRVKDEPDELEAVRSEVDRTARVMMAQSALASACAAHGEHWSTELLTANFSRTPEKLDRLLARQHDLEAQRTAAKGDQG